MLTISIRRPMRHSIGPVRASEEGSARKFQVTVLALGAVSGGNQSIGRPVRMSMRWLVPVKILIGLPCAFRLKASRSTALARGVPAKPIALDCSGPLVPSKRVVRRACAPALIWLPARLNTVARLKSVALFDARKPTPIDYMPGRRTAA